MSSVEPLSQYSVIFYSITLCAGAYALFSQFIQKKFGNPKRVKEIQTEMTEINKKYADAMKSKDDSKLKRAEDDQKRIPSLMFESMKYQFTPLLILLPLLFVIPAFLRYMFPVFDVETPLPIPLFPLQILRHFNLDGFPNFRSLYGAYGWFWVAVVFIGLFASIMVWAYNEVKKMLGPKDAKAKQ